MNNTSKDLTILANEDFIVALAIDSKSIVEFLIISLIFKPVLDTNYAFRNFYYIIIYIS